MNMPMLLTTPAPPISENAVGVRCQIGALQTHKAGNHPHECEDSVCFDAEAGRIALSDGAGEGIFSREWSGRLVDSFIRERPDLADDEQGSAWLVRCRRAWFEQIDYAKLGWAHRARVDRHGSGATLLTLQLYRVPESDALAFHAQAVGDSCLFWMRGGQCLGLFPFQTSAEFPAMPDLFTTHGADAPPVLQAGGYCEPGDCFLLATDAVSQWLYRQLEAGRPIDGERYRRMTSADWQQEIDALRSPHNRDDPHAPTRIDNDDCTLLVVSVAPAANVV